MKKFVSVFIFALLFSCAYALTNTSPVGYWKQYDDHTGKLQSIFKIYKAKDNTLSGKVIAGFKVEGHKPTEYCNKCPGAFKGKRIKGLSILWGMKFEDGYWQEGKILDPTSGKTYSAEMRLSPNGQALHLRGYIGISLFGRTQTWKRIDSKKELNRLLAKSVDGKPIK